MSELILDGGKPQELIIYGPSSGDTYTKKQIDEKLDKKVDKVEGKELSSNDFTDEYKEKLDNFDPEEVGAVKSVNGKTGEVVITKADVKLQNVDDTSDMNKPVSTATQAALDEKADKTSVYNKTSSDNRYLPKNTVSGVIPQTKFSIISDAINYQIWGNSVQNGTPSPDNPVEIQSVGDLVTDETSEYYGKYKIPIKICGNNLLNINTFEPYKTGRITIDGDTITYNGSWYISNDIDLKAGTTVTCSFNMTGYDATASASNKWRIQYADGTYSPTYMDSGDNISLIKDASKIMIYVSQGASVSATISNIQLEFGTVATEYEQYREETINIYIDEPLRKIGDFADYIDFLRGKVVRNIIKDILEVRGLSSIGTVDGYYNYNRLYNSRKVINDQNQKQVFSNKMIGLSIADYKSYVGECISCNNSNTAIFLKISNNRFSEYSIAAANQWLNENPVDIYYVVNTPIEESITLEPIPLQDGINNIITETTIQPSNVVVEYYQNPSDLFNEIIKIIRGDNMGRTEEQLDNMIALTNQLVKQNETIIKQTAQKAEEEK